MSLRVGVQAQRSETAWGGLTLRHIPFRIAEGKAFENGMLIAGNENGARNSGAVALLKHSVSGGAGNRTPVRSPIHHEHYVRIPPIDLPGQLASGQPTAR